MPDSTTLSNGNTTPLLNRQSSAPHSHSTPPADYDDIKRLIHKLNSKLSPSNDPPPIAPQPARYRIKSRSVAFDHATVKQINNNYTNLPGDTDTELLSPNESMSRHSDNILSMNHSSATSSATHSRHTSNTSSITSTSSTESSPHNDSMAPNPRQHSFVLPEINLSLRSLSKLSHRSISRLSRSDSSCSNVIVLPNYDVELDDDDVIQQEQVKQFQCAAQCDTLCSTIQPLPEKPHYINFLVQEQEDNGDIYGRVEVVGAWQTNNDNSPQLNSIPNIHSYTTTATDKSCTTQQSIELPTQSRQSHHVDDEVVIPASLLISQHIAKLRPTGRILRSTPGVPQADEPHSNDSTPPPCINGHPANLTATNRIKDRIKMFDSISIPTQSS